MIKELLIIKLFQKQEKMEILLSFSLGLLYFALPTAVAILIVANFVLLYFYYLLYFLLFLFMVTVFISFHANDRIIETLQNYKVIDGFIYELFIKRMNVLSVVFLFAAHIIAYIVIINY